MITKKPTNWLAIVMSLASLFISYKACELNRETERVLDERARLDTAAMEVRWDTTPKWTSASTSMVILPPRKKVRDCPVDFSDPYWSLPTPDLTEARKRGDSMVFDYRGGWHFTNHGIEYCDRRFEEHSNCRKQ